MIKTSVFLKEDVHMRLRLKAVQEGISLQKIMATIAEGIVSSESDPLSGTPKTALENLTPQQIRDYKQRLERIFKSGNREAILCCRITIESSELLIEHDKQLGPA